MESEILNSNEEVKVVPNKLSEEIKELGDMTETKRTSKLNDSNKDVTECNLLEKTNSNKLKTKSWEQLKFNGDECYGKINIQNLQFSSQGQLTYHKSHLAASDSLLNQTVQESTNQKEIKHSLSASNLNINVESNIPTKLHKDNKSINSSLNNSEHHSFANDFNIAETFDDNQLERISLKTSLCHQENVGVHNKQTEKYSCDPSENSSFDKLGNEKLIEKNAINSDKAIVSSEIDFIIQNKHNNDNESKQDSIDNQADSVNILKERSSDGISMCSSQSRESEDESDALLSELECELESGNEEISGVSCTQLNGIKANLLHQSKYTKSLMQKFKNHPRYPSFYNTSKQAIEYFELQIDFLEKANSQLQKELKEVNEKHSDEKNEIKKQLIQVKSDLGEKIEKLQKQYEGAQKERDNMVLRYAQSERDVINLKKVRDEFEKKLKDAAKEREGILNRIKGLNTEKSRLCNNLDSKSSEISALRRESERLREEVNSRDIRIKWTQNKLKTEMDAHKETQTKLEHTLLRLQQTREEAEQVRKDCQEMIRRYQEAEEIKSVNLDHQLREKLSELEVQKQERSDQEEVYQLVRHELEALKKKHKLTIEENNQLTVKINILEKERLDHEQIVSKLKEQQSILRQEVVDLSGRLAEMENLKIQLEREKERVLNSQKEVERFCQVNAELQCDMEACRNKEGELLEFTERLTAKSVALQSEYSLLETKAQTLEDEMNRINKKCTELENQNIELIDQLEDERKQRKEETQLLARKLAEKTKTVEDLTVKLEDAVNENKVTKRRHITSIKELSRELLQAKRRLENYEINHTTGDSVSLGSRTSSTGSLDILTNNNVAKISNDQNPTSHAAPAVTFSGGKIPSSHSSQTKTSETKVNSQNASLSNNSPLSEVNKQMLIERIVKLQRSLARKNEKIEFQEEHINHLIDEIKKKTRIIQSYIIREEAGALATNTMDQNKAVVAKKGGVMASVYRSHVADSHMSLELSLEINNKLQAVLEDTILKNITLKENINTLGEEIARVVEEHRTLQTQLTKYKSGK